MKNYSIDDIIPNTHRTVGYYTGVFEDTPDPTIAWPHRHDFYSLVWFTKGEGINVIDFDEHEITPNRIFTINPNQIHNWHYSIDSCGYFLLIDAPDAKQFHIDFSTPFIDLKMEDTLFIEEVFKRMVNGNNPLPAISYLLSLLKTAAGPVNNSNPTLSEIKRLIAENLDKNLAIHQYAAELGIDSRMLNQICKDETGLSPKQLELDMRITEAKRLLLYTALNTSEIAFRLGFADTSYFSRIFKNKAKISPSAFREKYLKNSRKS